MRNERDFLLVGVTGGIGSGKSLVCSHFEQLGRTVLKADPIAQEIADGDPDAHDSIISLLGAGAYRDDGSMDRQFVAGKVFVDHRLLQMLNTILHPRVIATIERRAMALPLAQRRPYVVVEAALIYESGMDALLDQVIVVDADEETRIRRVMDRDHAEREAVLRRIAVQLPAAKKVALADFVIRNDANAVALDAKVRFLDTLLTAMAPAQESAPGGRL
jgi:dephospho-CoA kinase